MLALLSLDLCGSYRDVCFLIISSTVHLCFRCVSFISQHSICLNDTTFSFVLGSYDWRQEVTRRPSSVTIKHKIVYMHTAVLRLLFLFDGMLSCFSHVLLFCDAADCSTPGFFVPGIFLAGILEWVAMPSSRGSSQPRD